MVSSLRIHAIIANAQAVDNVMVYVASLFAIFLIYKGWNLSPSVSSDI